MPDGENSAPNGAGPAGFYREPRLRESRIDYMAEFYQASLICWLK